MGEFRVSIPELNDELKVLLTLAIQELLQESVQREKKSKDWMQQKEVCEWLEISFSTLQKWRATGLKVSVIQGKTLISKQEITRFLVDHQT